MSDGNQATEIEALKARISSLETLVWNLGTYLKAYSDSKDLNSEPIKGIAGTMNDDHTRIMNAILK